MPDVRPHDCLYTPEHCHHHVTLEQWAVAHPDEAWELLSEVHPDSRSADRIRQAINATPPVNTVHSPTTRESA